MHPSPLDPNLLPAIWRYALSNLQKGEQPLGPIKPRRSNAYRCLERNGYCDIIERDGHYYAQLK